MYVTYEMHLVFAAPKGEPEKPIGLWHRRDRAKAQFMDLVVEYNEEGDPVKIEDRGDGEYVAEAAGGRVTLKTLTTSDAPLC